MNSQEELHQGRRPRHNKRKEKHKVFEREFKTYRSQKPNDDLKIDSISTYHRIMAIQ